MPTVDGIAVRFVSTLRAPPLNAHYEGEYSEQEMRWRRVCAADKAASLVAMLDGHSVETVLEVGRGTGCLLAELERQGVGSRHFGVDIADPKAHVDPSAAHLDMRYYDGERLPFADDSFDLVVASHVLEHVPDERGFLKEVARVSRKLIYIEVPCELTLRNSQAALQTTLNIGHLNSYTPASFALSLETSEVEPIAFQLFSSSDDVAYFFAESKVSKAKEFAKEFMRRSMLRGPLASLAPKVFVYHCGALGRPRG